MFKSKDFSLALLRHDNLKRCQLLLYTTFIFFKTIMVRSNHPGAKYKVEQFYRAFSVGRNAP